MVKKILKLVGIGVGLLILLIGLAVVYLFASAKFARTVFVNEKLTMEHKLKIPRLLPSKLVKGEKIFDLTAMHTETDFLDGKGTKTLGYNADYLGPTLVASASDKVRILVHNELGEDTTVHWHGMHVPAAMDGGPYQVIEPGSTWEAHWTITNPASTLWYHSHVTAKTGEQVYDGLAGLFFIEDPIENALNLPHTYGVDDIPLLVQDRQFDAQGQFVYSHKHGGVVDPGMLGDTILVNGTVGPYIEVPANLIRLRLVNGSNARRFNFAFANGKSFFQIASDGGLLEAPVELKSLILAPGERAEILVDMKDVGEPLTLVSLPIPSDLNPIKQSMYRLLTGTNDEHQEFKLVELRPKAGKYAALSIPTKLTSLAHLQATDAARTREFVLDTSSINDKRMDHSRVDAIVNKNDVEIWTVKNYSPTYHPFHIHGVQFEILDRDGQKPSPSESGYKDTVLVEPEHTVRLLMKFDGYADSTLPYMFHCHILEHEDMGMMGQFIVVEPGTKPEDIKLMDPGPVQGMEH